MWTTPLSLSFLQTKQQLLLKKLVAEVDSYQLQFKLGPAYGLYMVAKHLYGAEFQVGSSASEQRKTVVTGLKTICSHLKRAIKVCVIHCTFWGSVHSVECVAQYSNFPLVYAFYRVHEQNFQVLQNVYGLLQCVCTCTCIVMAFR